MLWTPPTTYNSFISTNLNSATISDAGFSSQTFTSGAANTKGSVTACIAGSIRPGYGLGILLLGGNASATIRRQMVDIMIDYGAGAGNAGSTWSVLIANLYANSPGFTSGVCGFQYFFPILIPLGAAIGARFQDVAATQTMKIIVSTLGPLSRQEQGMKLGTGVETIGATTASTSGVAVTPGTNVKGSFSASLGTLTRKCFFFQLGIGSADTTMTLNSYLFDLHHGASQQYPIIQDLPYCVESTERAGKDWMGTGFPYRDVPGGENLYVRGAGCGGAPDTSMDAVAYAVY